MAALVHEGLRAGALGFSTSRTPLHKSVDGELVPGTHAQPEELLAGMDAWNTKHHGASGPTERVRESTVTEAEAEAQVMTFLEEHCDPRTAPLAGNSIHQDRRFIALYMPLMDAFLHYRMIDVSTIKELTQRWYPESYSKRPGKRGNHRAIDDILESIEELRYYRSAVFRDPGAL